MESATDNTCIDDMLIRFGRLVVVLEDWASWNSRYQGLPQTTHSVGLTSGYSASKSFDDMIDDMDSQIFKIVETSVDDLPPAQRAAINRRYGLCNVFRFPRDNYPEMLLAAHERLLVVLPRKGVVL